MKKILLAVVLIVIMLSLAACDEYMPVATQAPVFETQSKQNEENVQDLIGRMELPRLTRSLDFENVSRRLEYLNQSNNIGYIYLLTANGQLVKEVQVLGKVTSLNTYITPMDDVKIYRSVDLGEYNGDVYLTVQAPDLDGTYGENVSGIFWFTPDGVYQEWTGLYLFSAERLSFTTQPLLVEMVN